jgi:hypothetical protein
MNAQPWQFEFSFRPEARLRLHRPTHPSGPSFTFDGARWTGPDGFPTSEDVAYAVGAREAYLSGWEDAFVAARDARARDGVQP